MNFYDSSKNCSELFFLKAIASICTQKKKLLFTICEKKKMVIGWKGWDGKKNKKNNKRKVNEAN